MRRSALDDGPARFDSDPFRSASDTSDDGDQEPPSTVGVFVFDPGDVVGSDDEALTELLATLERLVDPYEVVLAVNERELHELASVLPTPPDGETDADTDADADDDRLRALREEVAIEAVVMHAKARAAATPRQSRRSRTWRSTPRSGGPAAGTASTWPWPSASRPGGISRSRSRRVTRPRPTTSPAAKRATPGTSLPSSPRTTAARLGDRVIRE